MNVLSYATWLISFFAFAYSLLKADNSPYPLIYLLPLSLWLLSIIFYQVFNYFKNSWVFKIFILQALVRYPIMAILYCMGSIPTISYNYYANTVIVIMVVELITCFSVLTVLSKKQSTSYLQKSNNLVLNKNYLFIYSILLIMFFYILISGAFSKINFIFSLADYVGKSISGEDLNTTTFGGILFTPFKTLLALVVIQGIYASSIKGNMKKWLYFLIIIVSSSFIVGLSRFSLLQFTLPILILITYLTSIKESKKIVVYSVITMGIAILISSLAKFSRYGNEATVDQLVDVKSINAYFAGPDNISNGLAAYDSITSLNPILYLINDTFQNIPILSKLTLDDYKLNIIFNKQYYGHNLYADQIVPLDISGLFHFGILGIPFYYCFFLVIALFFERKSYKTTDFFYKYVYIGLSISFSYVFMKNMSSFYSGLVVTFLFLVIPLWLVNVFKVRKVIL